MHTAGATAGRPPPLSRTIRTEIQLSDPATGIQGFRDSVIQYTGLQESEFRDATGTSVEGDRTTGAQVTLTG